MSFFLSSFSNPFEALRNLQQNLDHFWWENTPYYNSQGLSSSNIFPPVNIFEKEGDKLVVMAELPDLSKESLKLSLKENTLTIEGKRNCYQEEELKELSFHRREREEGNFSRTLRLPFKVDNEKVEAKMENGILIIEMEKSPEAKTKEITIK